MTIPMYILHLLLMHLLIISAVVIQDSRLNLIKKKIIRKYKGKEICYRRYQVLLIEPKNGQVEFIILESKALFLGLISNVNRIIIYL